MNDSNRFSNGLAYRDAPPRNEAARRMARGLGWVSIGLGLAELLGPGSMARAAGLRTSDRMLRGYGARELVTGMALLTSDNPEPYVWARVAGDALDIATVGAQSAGERRGLQRTVPAMLALLGVTALDLLCAAQLRREARQRAARPVADYSSRSGFPRSVDEMRGAASFARQRSAIGRDETRSAAASAVAEADPSELGHS
jgi:hypothetical protein